MQQTSRRPAGRNARSTRPTARAPDAIALLKADHRQVEEWFAQFEKSRADAKKAELARRICEALRIHMAIEEKLFYPAFLEASGEEALHHEAEVEHAGARSLIAQIESSSPRDDYFDAKVTVLAEMIKHHVKEEEQRDGMFAKARSSGMDLEFLGEQLRERKQALQHNGIRSIAG